MRKKGGLGRGLDALIPQTATAPDEAPQGLEPHVDAAGPSVEMVRTEKETLPGLPGLLEVGVESIVPNPRQPRQEMRAEELDELAASVAEHGILQPLVVTRTSEEGIYSLIAGERRWRAAILAGLTTVPAIVKEASSREMLELALVENLQRADLNPIEEAAAFQRLLEEFGLTQEEVAARVGKERSTVANAVRLLRLPTSVRQLVEERRLSMGHARALLGLDTEGAIEVAARTVVAKGLSVRGTEELVRKQATSKGRSERIRPEAPTGPSASVRDLEERLTRSLGGPVTIDEDALPPGGEPSKRGGTVSLRYLDLDHLDRLLERLLT